MLSFNTVLYLHLWNTQHLKPSNVISLFFFLSSTKSSLFWIKKNTSLNDIYRKCVRTAFLHRDKLYPNHLVPGRQQLLNPPNSCRFCVAGWPGSLFLQKHKIFPVRFSLVTCCVEAKALHSICGNSQTPGATSS